MNSEKQSFQKDLIKLSCNFDNKDDYIYCIGVMKKQDNEQKLIKSYFLALDEILDIIKQENNYEKKQMRLF